MLFFKIIFLILIYKIAIWLSDPDPNFPDVDLATNSPDEKPVNRFLQKTPSMIILLGSATIALFMPHEQIGLNLGSLTGTVIIATGCVMRVNIRK